MRHKETRSTPWCVSSANPSEHPTTHEALPWRHGASSPKERNLDKRPGRTSRPEAPAGGRLVSSFFFSNNLAASYSLIYESLHLGAEYSLQLLSHPRGRSTSFLATSMRAPGHDSSAGAEKAFGRFLGAFHRSRLHQTNRAEVPSSVSIIAALSASGKLGSSKRT